MKINMAKQGAFGIMRELMAGGKEGNAIIQSIGHKANRFVLGSSKNGILFQHRPASVANGFTGIGLSPFAVGLGVAGIAGAGIANGVSAKDAEKIAKLTKGANGIARAEQYLAGCVISPKTKSEI